VAYSGPAYWEVIYKAIADFGDVLTEAAKAKAALQSLSDSAKAEGDVEAAASAKAAAAHRVDTAAINEERRALEQLAAAAKLAQVWTAWGGRNSPEQHMSDLERELNLRTLINRQEWLGFTSPQQAYAWRQNELNQRKQMNYAEWAGYYTADQYLSYLQKQRSELSDLNAVLLRRADVYKANTDAALGYANALSGTHKSAGQLGENIDLSGVDQFQQALIGLPDVVSTKLELDDADAMARLAQYETLLRGVPHAETTVLTSSQVRGAAPVTGEPQAEVIPVSYGGPYQEQFARILAEIADLNRMRAEIPVEFHIDPTEVAALHVRLGQISVSDVITAHLASAGGGVGGGGGGPPPVAPGAAEPPDDAAAKWAALAAAEKEAGDAADADALKFAALHAAAAGDADAAAKLAYAYQALSASQKDAGDSGGAAAVSLLAAKAAAGGTAGALGQLAGGFIGAAQGWAALATRIALFGGFFSVALWHIIADAILEFVIALGGAIIGVAAMAAAVGIFIGVANLAQDTLGRISDRLKATYTAASATGQAIYPLANSFDKLARVIRPEVWQLYGDALTLVGGRMGLIGRIAESTGRTIDTLAARFTVWLNTPSVQQGFAHLIAAGLGFARQFGQIFKNLGDAILGFLKAAEMTHIAEDIGVVLIALTKLLDLVAHLPTPLLAAAFGLHALYLWGGLASTALLSLLDPLRAVAIAVGGLDVAESALGRLPADASALDKLKATVADIGAGFGALPGRITGTRTAIQQVSEVTGTAASDLAVFAANAEKTSGGVRALATSTEDGAALVEKYGTGLKGAAADAVNLAVAAGATEAQVARVATATEGAGASTGFFSGILARLGGLAGLATAGLGLLAAAAGFFAYKALTAKDNAQQWIDSMNKGLGSQSLFTVIGKTTSDLAAVTQQLAGSQHLSAQAAHELSGAQTDLSSKLQLELVHVGDISHAYGVSMPLALGLLNTAGVKTSALFSDQAKVWAAAQQQVAGLVKGYAAMGQGLTQLQGDVSVQLVMNSDQLKSMTTLNSAWDQWLATVTGGESTFVKAQQDFGAIVTAGKAAGASMTGLNANSLTLRSAFISMIPDAGKVQDAIRTQSAVLEDGAKGSALLTRATKDLAAEMIPLAGNSLAARASIIAVAEEADPAVNTWQKLTKWVGKEGAAGAANDLQSIMFKLVTPVSDLQKDAAKLTATLQQDLNPAMANAEFNALGGQKAFSTFASDLAKMGPNSQDTIQAGQKVASILLAIDKNSKTARDQFVAWAESMGLSRDKAEALWVSASKLGQTRYQLQIENNIQVTQGKIADLQKQLDSTTDPRKHRQIQLEINIEKQKLENFKEELRKLPTAQQVKIEITHYQADIADLEKKLAETTDPAKRHQIQLQISYDENKIKRLQGELGTAGQSADSIRKGLEQSAPAADRLGRSGLWAQLGDRFRTNMQEMGTWFTVTLPHAVESFGRFMAGSWSISYQQFFRDFASPLAKFFGTSVPDFFTQTIPHAAALAWDTAYQNFMRGFGSPVAKVFTSTLPGYFTSLWHGFLLDFGDPIGHFVTVTIPGFFANIGKFIGQDFSRWWSDNDKNWVTPLGRVFENLIPGWLIGSDKNFAGSASGWWKSFNGSYVQPAGHFFTTTMPSWLSDVGTFFAGSWNKSWAWFDAHIIGGFSRLWNNDFPSWLNDVLRFFESDWDKAWSWFSSHIIDGWSRLWNSTFPSWLNAVLRFFESTWDKAWSFFDHTLIGGWSHLFNSTFPSWLSSLGRFFSNT
jgi:predicted  nucleic acid-binding Zn-ribbon protein